MSCRRFIHCSLSVPSIQPSVYVCSPKCKEIRPFLTIWTSAEECDQSSSLASPFPTVGFLYTTSLSRASSRSANFELTQRPDTDLPLGYGSQTRRSQGSRTLQRTLQYLQTNWYHYWGQATTSELISPILLFLFDRNILSPGDSIS